MKSQERQIHQHIRREIERRIARADAPREIRTFLLERWALLLHGIYANHGDAHPDWEAGWHSVNALLWSLHPKQPGRETQQLLRLLPTLLGRLQEGCEAMDLPQEERDRLFGQLALLHAAVVRGGLQGVADGEGAVSQLGFDDDFAMGEDELIDLVSGEAEGRMSLPVSAPASPIMTTTPTAPATPPPLAPTASEPRVPEPQAPEAAPLAPAVSQSDHAGAIGRLQVGDAIHFKRASGGEMRLIVQWINPTGGMYLLADDTGSNALSLTLARLAEKFASGDAWRD